MSPDILVRGVVHSKENYLSRLPVVSSWRSFSSTLKTPTQFAHENAVQNMLVSGKARGEPSHKVSDI